MATKVHMATKVPMATKVSMATKVPVETKVSMATNGNKMFKLNKKQQTLAVLASYVIWACLFQKSQKNKLPTRILGLKGTLYLHSGDEVIRIPQVDCV